MSPDDGFDPVLEPQSLRDEVAEILAAAEGRVTIAGVRERLRHFLATPSQLLDVLDELVGNGFVDRFTEPGARSMYQWVTSKPVRLPPPTVTVRVKSEAPQARVLERAAGDHQRLAATPLELRLRAEQRGQRAVALLAHAVPADQAVEVPTVPKAAGTQRQVLELLQDGQARQAREIASELQVPVDRVSVALSNLRGAGKVTKDSNWPASWSIEIGIEAKPQQASQRHAIYDFIRGAGRPVRACEISKALSLSNSNAWNRLQFLIADGAVKKTGDGRYEAVDPRAVAAPVPTTSVADMPRKLALLSELAGLLNPKIAELLNDIRRDLQRFGKAQS